MLIPEMGGLPVGVGDALLFGGLKLMFVVFFLLYMVFSLVVARQVRLMRQTIETPIHGTLVLLSWLYGGLAVVVFLLTLFTL